MSNAGPQAGAQFVGGAAAAAAAAAAYYFGASDGGLPWASAAWVDANGVLALVDGPSSGIARAGSVFTFASAGIYAATLCVNVGSLGVNIGFRWRTSAPATESSFAAWGGSAPAFPMLTFQAPIAIAAAGETRTLQYAMEAVAGAGAGPIPIDGEDCATARLNIVQVSP